MEQVFQTEKTFILVMEQEPGRGRWSCALLQLCPRLWHRSPHCVMCEVRWRAKGTAMEVRWISIYIRERWFITSPPRESSLNPLQQIWGDILSLWIFISCGCCCHLSEQELKCFIKCSWQMWSFLTCHWCCKNQIDKMLECRILLAPVCFLLIFLFLHPILYFLVCEKRFVFYTAIAHNHKWVISALSVAELK